MLIAADEIVVVATPDLASLRNAKNMIELLRQNRPNDAPPRFVLNQVGQPKRPEIPPKDFAETIGVDAAAIVDRGKIITQGTIATTARWWPSCSPIRRLPR